MLNDEALVFTGKKFKRPKEIGVSNIKQQVSKEDNESGGVFCLGQKALEINRSSWMNRQENMNNFMQQGVLMFKNKYGREGQL